MASKIYIILQPGSSQENPGFFSTPRPTIRLPAVQLKASQLIPASLWGTDATVVPPAILSAINNVSITALLTDIRPEDALFAERRTNCGYSRFMASYSATVEWSRNGANFLDNKYSREHQWHFDGGITIAGSSSAHVVPVPYSNPSAVDPEEALIVALASCHMLSFLYVAGKQGFIVDDYRDQATGKMAKNEAGKFWISEVTLNPKTHFSGEKLPNASEIADLHHLAHQECFIANSVKTDVRIAH